MSEAARLAEGAERQLLVEQWNAAADDGLAEATIPERFARAAAKTPQAPAVLSRAGNLSYAELDRRSNQLARRLQALGVGPDVTVALCLERAPRLIVALVAILKAGGAYLPLEPSYPPSRMAFLIEDGAPRVLLTESALAGLLPEFAGPKLLLDREEASLEAESADPIRADITPDSLAYVLYTSGSTGKPKGVAVPHAAIDRLVQEPGFTPLHAGVCLLQAAPVAFDASTLEIWGALTNGGRLALHHEAVAALHGPTLTGRVSLGVPDDYAAAYLAPLLGSFSVRHAGVEITLVCEQSTLLIPKVQRGELDLAVVTRDRPQRGQLLFHEPLVWVGAAKHEAWRRDPLPIAVYEPGSLARRDALSALTAQRRPYRIVYNSSSLAGHVAAVESGLAVAVLTRCSVPAGLQVLHERQGLPALPAMEVAAIRSKASAASGAVGALYEQVLSTLQRPSA